MTTSLLKVAKVKRFTKKKCSELLLWTKLVQSFGTQSRSNLKLLLSLEREAVRKDTNKKAISASLTAFLNSTSEKAPERTTSTLII